MTEEIKEEILNAAQECDEAVNEEKQEKPKKCKNDSKKLNAKIAELEAELEAERAKSAEANDKYLRTLAEYDNFRRRSKEEREGMYSDAIGDSLSELLPIIDNLKRASLYTDTEKVAEGVQMILKSVPASLEKLGVEEFGKVGEEFDPSVHNAVLHEESEDFGENVISDVLQTGYRRGDKILRFAMVKVAN